jgi:hypothetical protein
VVSIILRKTGIDSLRARQVSELLGKFENLEVIDLSDNSSLGTSGVAIVLEGMSSALKSVSIKASGLGLVYAEKQRLGFRRPLCSDADWTRLESALRRLPALEDIDLSENMLLGSSGVARVLEALKRGAKSLKSVSLKCTGLGLQPDQYTSQKQRDFAPLLCSEPDWMRLEAGLRGLAALETIDFSNNGALGTPGVARLMHAVQSGVKSVTIEGTGLGYAADGEFQGHLCIEKDHTTFESALRGLAALEAIDFSNNWGLATLGVARVLEGLCCGVKSVSMKNTRLGHRNTIKCSDAEWTRLEAALRRLAALEAIDLSDNEMLSTSGVLKLLEIVGSEVTSVSMKNTGLGLGLGYDNFQKKQCSDAEWTMLEAALRGLAALEAIDLSDNKTLGTSGVRRLVSCCAGEAFCASIIAALARAFVTLLCREPAAAAGRWQHCVSA